MNTKEMKKTKKMLKTSGLALLICAVMLIGTTFAWFTDTVTNSGNKIEAGTLKIGLERWDAEKNAYVAVERKALFNETKWEPGYTDVEALRIVNNGSLALKYQIDFKTEALTADNKKLADVIEVYHKVDGNAEDGMPTNLDGFMKSGTLADFLENPQSAVSGILNEKGHADYVMIALHMPETAGNEYQNLKTGYFDILVRATQNTYEEDGFGSNQYDQDAELPWDGVTEEEITPGEDGSYAVASPANLAWLADELTTGTTSFAGKTIVLDKDIDMNNEEWKPIVLGGNDAGITFDGKGHTIRNLKVDDVAKAENGVSAGYGGGFIRQAVGKVTIKDLKFDNVTVAPGKTISFNKVCNVVGVVLGYSYSETVFENVQVTNSMVEGFGKVGVMLGMGADPGIKVTFKNCVSKNNTIKAAYNAGGLAGTIQRAGGVDNTVIENCTVEGNIFVPYYKAADYVELKNQQATYKNNDVSSGEDVTRTISGKYWNDGTYYWGAYGNYYVSYGSGSYDAPITTEGPHKGKTIANSEICINDVSEIPNQQ